MVNQTFPVIYKNSRFLVDPIIMSSTCRKFRDLINHTNDNQNVCLRINSTQFSVRNVSNFLKLSQKQSADIQNSDAKEILSLAKIFQANINFTTFNFETTEIDINDNDNILIIQKESEALQSAFYYDLSDLDFDESVVQDDATVCTDFNIPTKNRSVCYQIKIEKPLLKCNRLYLMKDDQILFMAKQRFNEIHIGKGQNCHLKKNKSQNVAKMTRDYKGFNIAKVKNQEFKIKYLKKNGRFYIKTAFDHKCGRQLWGPRESNVKSLLRGEYDHDFIKSNKNLVLVNERNNPTFILRKSAKNIFEAECSQQADPTVIFAIAISQIIGPIA